MANTNKLFEDDEKERLGNGYVPDDNELRDISGINKDQEDEHDKNAADGAEEDLAERENNPSGSKKGKKDDDKSVGAGGLGAAEAGVGLATDALGKGFNPAGSVSTAAKLSGFMKDNRRKGLFGGGIIAAIIGILLFMFISLIPLKLMSITQDLQNKFFAASEQASQKEVNNLFSRYVSKKVIPGMQQGKCTSTRIHYNCTALSSGDTPVGRLYNAWRDAKLENKLATNYGLEIRKVGNQYYLKSNNLDSQIKLGQYNGGDTREIDGKVYAAFNKTEARRQVYQSLSDETKWKRVMYKIKVTGLLDRKYGIRWCVTACSGIDRTSESLADKKLAFKSYLNKLVIEPQSEVLSLAVDCAASSFDCAKPDNWSSDGESNSKFTRDLQDRLIAFRDANGPESLDKLAAKGEEMQTKGVMRVLIEDTLAKIIGKDVAVKAIDLADPIGWIDLLTHLVAGLENAPDAIRYMRYAAQTEAAVKVFSMYRTTADEIKTGNVDAAVIGSMTSSLNGSTDGGGTDQGGVGAEQTPLYAQIIDNTSPGKTNYKCDDGKTISSDKYVCDEEKLSHSPSLPDTYATFEKTVFTYMPGSPQKLIEVWNFISDHLTGWLTSAVMALIRTTPVGRGLLDFVTSQIQGVMTAVIGFIGKLIIPSALTDNPSGGRMFDIAAAGADVGGNNFAHYGQGGQLLNPQQIAQALNEQQQEYAYEFHDKSAFAKVFDSSNTQSVVSKIALGMPDSPKAGINSLFSSILHSPTMILGSVIGSGRVNAAAAKPINDPFGIMQYGYDSKDAVFTQDPEEYWATHDCDNPDRAIEWGKTGVLNKTTGEYDNAATNGCALIQSAVGSAGAIYNDNVLTSEDLAVSGDNINQFIAEKNNKKSTFGSIISKDSVSNLVGWVFGGDK